MGAPTKRVELTPEDLATLRLGEASGKTEQRLAVRARGVLAAAEGLSLKAIIVKTGLGYNSRLKWRKRFLALDRTQPLFPMKSGAPKRMTATYKRHGTTCLLAALVVHEGAVHGRCVDSAKHENFLNFLKQLYRSYPGKQLHVITDNLSSHKHKDVLEWVDKRRRMTLHFTPAYASWLNQVEIWCNIFTRDVVKGGIWRSKQALIKQITKYIKRYNEDRAHSFRWTYEGKPLQA